MSYIIPQTLNPFEAPKGYIAVYASINEVGCEGCAFEQDRSMKMCATSRCYSGERQDRKDVIFKKIHNPFHLPPLPYSHPSQLPTESLEFFKQLQFAICQGYMKWDLVPLEVLTTLEYEEDALQLYLGCPL